MPTYIPTGGYPTRTVVSPDGRSFVVIINEQPVYFGMLI